MAQPPAELRVMVDRLGCYASPAVVCDQASALRAHYPSLRPSVRSLMHNSGAESSLMTLSGTIETGYRGARYNTPLDIYVCEMYPEQPPRVYVRPTRGMQIKAGHKHVDGEGLVYMPYLHEWRPRSSSLLELCGRLRDVFSAEPPVYAKPPEALPQPPGPPTYPGASTPPPYGAAVQPQPPPPPAYEDVAAPAYAAPPEPPYAAPREPPYAAAAPRASPPPPPPAPAEDAHAAALRKLTGRLQAELQRRYAESRDEIDGEFAKSMALRQGGEAVEAAVADLAATAASLETATDAARATAAAVEDWLAAAAAARASSAAAADVDADVAAVDPTSRQLLDAVAEFHSIEDALYFLDRALEARLVDLDAFLRHVRRLARKQFDARATIRLLRGDG